MNQLLQPRFTLLLAALAASVPAFAAPAARVDFAIGNVVAQGPDGARRSLVRGAQLASGETVLTNDGRAQMRFTDGAIVSLKPDSEFRIDDYRYNGRPDGEERGFFSLLKGGLRTITGLVGRNDHSKYQVRTVVATIGIRGTEYAVTYGRSINVNTADGVVEVCNSAGCLLLYPGDEGYVAGDASEPVLVHTGEERPKKADEPAELSEVESPANEREADGSALVLGGAPPQRLVFGLTDAGSGLLRSGLAGGTATIDANPQVGLTAFAATDGGTYSTDGSTLQSGSAGTTRLGEPVIGWGQWLAGGTTSIVTPFGTTTGNATLHYVVGEPTTLATLGDAATLPNAIFSSLGGSVSDQTGNSGTISASMDVSFSTLTVNNLLVNFNIASLNTNYQITGGGYAITTAGGLSFAGSGAVASGVSVPLTCTTCSAASISGAFFGANASHAGVSFDFTDSPVGAPTPSAFAGVAALQKLTGTP